MITSLQTVYGNIIFSAIFIMVLLISIPTVFFNPNYTRRRKAVIISILLVIITLLSLLVYYEGFNPRIR